MNNSEVFANHEIFPKGRDINVSFDKIQQFKQALQAWAFAAMEDGWTSTPMSPGSNKLTKGEFVAHVNIRDSYMGIDVWSMNGAAAIAKVPSVYNMEAIIAQTMVCHFCGETSDKLTHIAFANRACPVCAPVARHRLEVPGWCD